LKVCRWHSLLGYLRMSCCILKTCIWEYWCAVWNHGLTVAQSPTRVFAKEAQGPENHPPNCMWYAVWLCLCICWRTAPLWSEIWIFKLERRFFRSVTQSDSCLHDLLPQRRDSAIFPGFDDTLSTQYHELTKRSFIPYLNISNLIHKIALSAPYRRLYTDVWEGAQAVWVWGTPSWDRATENREFFTPLPVFYVQLKVIQSKFCLVWRNHNKRIKLPVW